MAAIPESHRDLLDAPVATLATIDDDGFPQLSEVWFLYDDDEIKISLNSSRHKTRNLVDRQECSLLILDRHATPVGHYELMNFHQPVGRRFGGGALRTLGLRRGGGLLRWLHRRYRRWRSNYLNSRLRLGTG